MYVLRGLLVCAECGHQLRGWCRLRDGVRYYRDPARLKGFACTQKSIVKAEELESQVGEWISRIVLPPDWQEQALQIVGNDEGETAQRETQRHSLQGQLERMRKLYLLGDIAERDYLAERDRLADEMAALRPVKRLDLERAAEILAEFRQVWQIATPAERQELVHALLRRVYVREGRIVAVEPRAEFHPLLSVAFENRPAAGELLVAESCQAGELDPSLPSAGKEAMCS